MAVGKAVWRLSSDNKSTTNRSRTRLSETAASAAQALLESGLVLGFWRGAGSVTGWPAKPWLRLCRKEVRLLFSPRSTLDLVKEVDMDSL